MAIRLQICSSHSVFCEIRIPVMVPVKPVIAANTSLFHVRSNARCAISSAVKLKVRAMANLTPKTKRSLGCTSSAVTVLSVVFRVNARLIQSVNGCASSAVEGNAPNWACHFSFSRSPRNCSSDASLPPPRRGASLRQPPWLSTAQAPQYNQYRTSRHCSGSSSAPK